MQRTLDAALDERLRYVERHREKMLPDARKDVEARRERLLAHVRELPALRDELLDARKVLAWTATYPEQVEQFGFPTNLALGLREPIERTLETTAQVDYGRVVVALEADADALAEKYHVQVLKALGTAPPRTPEREAMWTNDPDYQAYQKQQRERAIQLAEGFGHDPDRLTAEVRER